MARAVALGCGDALRVAAERAEVLGLCGAVAAGVGRRAAVPGRNHTTHSATSFEVVRVPALVSRALLDFRCVEQATVIVGVGTAGVLGGVLASGKTAATEAADTLLTSPAFSKAVRAGADGALTKTSQFKKWLTLQPIPVKKEIAAMGFIAWLSTNDQQTESQ